MAHGRTTGWIGRLVAVGATVAFAGAVVGACSAPPGGGGGDDGPIGVARSRVFTNGGFEMGLPGAPPQSWNVANNLNPNGVIQATPETLADLQLTAGGKGLTTTIAAVGQQDPDLGAAASLRVCRYGAQCARVNFHSSTNFMSGGTNNGLNVNSLSQTMTIGAGDVDPTDGKVHVRFVVAPVLQNPIAGHTQAQKPYYMVLLTNVTQGTTLYTDFNLSAQLGVPWKTINGGTAAEIDYLDWSLVDIAPGSPAINTGDMVQLDVIAGGCSLGGHFGEIYVDGVGAIVPGLFISGTGPSQVSPCSNITYNLTYKNGSAAAETGLVINFTTPPGTTYQSMTTPPGMAGPCVTPAVGAAGTIVCTFPAAFPLAAGAAGSFTVTVNVPCATVPPTLITAGTYSIQSTQETPLNGPKIDTEVGCLVDSQCAAGTWCHFSAVNACDPTLANGTPIPSDPGRTGTTLNGACTAAAGALVCTSAVCDAADNKCGYLNGDGPCTAANGGVVCRSGICDTDNLCGYANGDGPCTIATGPMVCRSGLCSSNGLCLGPGTCNVDADCTGGNWCNESMHTCTAKLPNGTTIPTDPPHTGPTLNGTCTPAAATLVCASGVCDTDNKCGYLNSDGPCTVATGTVVCRSLVCDTDGLCGYANGDGPCTAVTGGVVCRSGACSISLVCEPAGGCNVDADCSGGNWCDESTHTCTPKLANGTPIPTDPPHTGPTLNGNCTAAAALLVCASGVCDATNNECGYANGDGPCTGPTGPVLCQSGVCSVSGVCEPAGGCIIDADCPAADYCNTPAEMCVPKVPNGQPVPAVPGHTPVLNGTCTVPAGAAACASGVCDTADNGCGYANGDGPCDMTNGGTVCRSGMCSTTGTCEPMNGCNTDADCTAPNWCNESAHMCAPTLANGKPVPTDPPHTNPTLNGTCTAAAGALTCTSGVCDTNDNECGYANGDGPCTMANGGTVCRSGTCSTNGVCAPSGGCNVDADCTMGNWCNETTHMCSPTVPNGMPVPTDPAHATPTLDGTCTTAAAMLTCQSGVCDTKDNLCGYANGDGPCDMTNGGTVCRSGMCSTTGTCEPSGGCNVDADCPMGKWCNESLSMCTPTLPNGMQVPSDPPHTNPALNGTCTMAAGALTCSSGVCDTKDNECGYANGDGPCTAANGDSVCRSTLCGMNGTCVGCTMDSQCMAPTPHCNTMTGNCVVCTDSSQCSGNTPVCDGMSGTCVPCNGDNGSPASDPCPTTGQPFCFLAGPMMGTCGKCMMDSDCTGHAGNICNTMTGLCVTGCDSDAQCGATQWCNNPPGGTGQCTPKLPNGQKLPSTPSTVSTCSTMVGMRVCVSGVCDPKDNECGYANGDGPCTSNAECRNMTCDAMTKTCMQASMSSSSSSSGSMGNCVSDPDCPMGQFCDVNMCKPQLPVGQPCTRPTQCQSLDCPRTGAGGGPAGGGVCSTIVGSGNGVFCAVGSAGDGSRSAGGLAGLFGLVLAAGGLARRRRR